MGDSPQSYRVTQVQPDGKVWIEGFNAALDLSPKGTTANIGQEVNGWLNPTGKFGPYLKVAEERQASTNGSAPSGRRNDATGRSIERQVALKCAAEFYAGKTDTPVATIVATAEAFDEFLDNTSARSGGSPLPASPAADTPASPQGANSGAATSITSDVPDF